MAWAQDMQTQASAVLRRKILVIVVLLSSFACHASAHAVVIKPYRQVTVHNQRSYHLCFSYLHLQHLQPQLVGSYIRRLVQPNQRVHSSRPERRRYAPSLLRTRLADKHACRQFRPPPVLPAIKAT
jgi:hypothetical protein